MQDKLDAGRRTDQFGDITGGARASRAEENQPHARALALIGQLAFHLAFRDPGHEYTVRDKQDSARETAYVQLFHLIQADGVIEGWRGRKTRFLYPGDGYKYWAVTNSELESRVINRMRIEDDTARPRQEGRVS